MLNVIPSNARKGVGSGDPGGILPSCTLSIVAEYLKSKQAGGSTTIYVMGSIKDSPSLVYTVFGT